MISTLSANIHNVKTVTLKRESHNDTHWLEIEITDDGGFKVVVSCFDKPTIDIQCPLWFPEEQKAE